MNCFSKKSIYLKFLKWINPFTNSITFDKKGENDNSSNLLNSVKLFRTYFVAIKSNIIKKIIKIKTIKFYTDIKISVISN